MATHWKPNVEILGVLVFFLTSGEIVTLQNRFIFNYFNQLVSVHRDEFPVMHTTGFPREVLHHLPTRFAQEPIHSNFTVAHTLNWGLIIVYFWNFCL